MKCCVKTTFRNVNVTTGHRPQHGTIRRSTDEGQWKAAREIAIYAAPLTSLEKRLWGSAGCRTAASADNGAHAIGRRYQARRLRRHFFFLAVSAARRAAHTGHKADGNTAGGVSSPGRRNPGIVPWTSVPWTYSHSVNTSGSRVLRLRRSTRSKASRRSIMLLQVLRRLDRLLPVFPQPFIPAQYRWKFDHIAIRLL